MTFIDDTGDRARICVQIHYRSHDITAAHLLERGIVLAVEQRDVAEVG